MLISSVQPFKRMNNAIGSNMDALRDITRGKGKSERQMLYDITCEIYTTIQINVSANLFF